MTVPKHIKQRMHKIAKLKKIAAQEMRIIEAWLENKGFDIEDLRSGDGCSLEEFEYGNDITDMFCKKIEEMLALTENSVEKQC